MKKYEKELNQQIKKIEGYLVLLHAAATIGAGASYGLMIADDIEEAARDLKAFLKRV